MAHAPSPDPRRGYRGGSLGRVLEQHRQEGDHRVDDVDGSDDIRDLDDHTGCGGRSARVGRLFGCHEGRGR